MALPVPGTGPGTEMVEFYFQFATGKISLEILEISLKR